mgnify:CR=1 FL=1
MQNNIQDLIKPDLALSAQVISSATTVTGPIIDTANVREYVLEIVIGTPYTVNLLTACNVQVFSDDKSDMSSEAQAGSNVNIFSALAANTLLHIRVQAENYKRFQRVKVVTTGAPTSLVIGVVAITAQTEFRGTSAAPGSGFTLQGTI